MNRLALSLALLAVACLAPAAAEEPAAATAAAAADAPLTAKVELKVPAGAEAGPDFDVERATQAWVETLTPEQRARSKAYFEGGYWLQLFTFMYDLAVAWVFLFMGLSSRMRNLATRVSANATLQSAVYAALYVPVLFVLSFPLAWYAQFWRQHKYELATQTFGPWFGEQLINLAVSLLLVVALVAVLYAVFRRTGRNWWLWGSGVAMVFLIFTIFISPMWIDPLFNDYKALPSGPLRDRILSIAHASGVPADEVYWFDASRQTKKISANVAGFGSTTRIALNDNLLNRASTESIEAVMGHELGHYVLNHIYEFLVYFAAIIVIGFALAAWGFNRAVARWGTRWGVAGIADPAGVPLLSVLFSVYFFVMTPVMNSIIRSNEIEADRFGVATSGEADGFAMVSMQLAEYRKIDPGYWEEIIFYDHPSGANRVRAAMQWKKEHMPVTAVAPP
jgi:STE24 endopeptidase